MDNVLISDYSIEVRGFPKSNTHLTQAVFKDHFENLFGKVQEVYLARRYDGVLGYYKKQ